MAKQTHNLVIDKKYYFSFHADIATLNGVYSVSAIMNYEEVEAFLAGPVQDIYLAANKLDLYVAQQLNNKFRDEVYYKLESVENVETIFYMPDSLIVEYPLEDFKEIFKYMFLCEVGIIDNPQDLEAAVPLINQTIWQALGIDPITMISTFGKSYLSPAVIKAHTDTRLLNKQATTVYTQLAEARKENRNLKATLEKYETIILDLYNNRGTPIPEKTTEPVINSFIYAGDAFTVKTTIWDTLLVHTVTTWMISRTTDFAVPMIVEETSTTQLLTGIFNKPAMAVGKYYAKVRYGGVAIAGDSTLIYSEWSPVVSFDVS